MTTVAGAVSHWYWDREGFFERKKSAQESICKCSCTKFWTCFCLCGCKSLGKAPFCRPPTAQGEEEKPQNVVEKCCHGLRRCLEKSCELVAKCLQIKTSVVYDSYSRALFKHLGSICFGALIIAIVQFARAILAYVDQQTKQMQGKNILARVVMKVVQCCMWCFEKCLKFISKNGYIMVAMYGHSFCKAAYVSFGLMYDNVLLIATTTMVTNLLLFIGELAITFFCGWCAFMTLTVYPDYKEGGSLQPTSKMLPTILTMLAAWFVSSGFMSVYGMSIDTILMCCCMDKKENGKTGHVKMSRVMFRRFKLDDDGKVAYHGPEAESTKESTAMEASRA